jgi:hypothetical protein
MIWMLCWQIVKRKMPECLRPNNTFEIRTLEKSQIEKGKVGPNHKKAYSQGLVNPYLKGDTRWLFTFPVGS